MHFHFSLLLMCLHYRLGPWTGFACFASGAMPILGLSSRQEPDSTLDSGSRPLASAYPTWQTFYLHSKARSFHFIRAILLCSTLCFSASTHWLNYSLVTTQSNQSWCDSLEVNSMSGRHSISPYRSLLMDVLWISMTPKSINQRLSRIWP